MGCTGCGSNQLSMRGQGPSPGRSSAPASFLVFDHYLFSSTTTASVTSAPINLTANTPVLAVTVENAAPTITSLLFQLQGSYDGHAWEDIGKGADAR